ncbi:MAG: hypothetical protein K0M49_08580 [Arenimonas sp.]|nr:hypothetical protein [Arenimonas sp.]
MTSVTRTLPDTMTSPETGEIRRSGILPFELRYKAEAVTIDLPGYYPEGQGEGVHVGDDMALAGEALRVLKEKIDGIPSPKTIRRLNLA